MIPKPLKPLHSRLKNTFIGIMPLFKRSNPLKPLPSFLKNTFIKDSKPLNIEFYKWVSPIAIRLIEGGGIGEGLVREFKKDGELNQELLEEFVLRAAMDITTPSKEERKVHWTEWINKKFGGLYKELDKLNHILKGGGLCGNSDRVCKGAKTYKQMENVKKEMAKLKKIYLSKLNPPINPDKTYQLINAFRSYLPEVEKTFMDTQIINMLKLFQIEYKPHSVRIKEYRAEKTGKWYILKVRREEKPQ